VLVVRLAGVRVGAGNLDVLVVRLLGHVGVHHG
jgi:hypothetical protein